MEENLEFKRLYDYSFCPMGRAKGIITVGIRDHYPTKRITNYVYSNVIKMFNWHKR